MIALHLWILISMPLALYTSTTSFRFKYYESWRWIHWLLERWRTQRTAICIANCRIQWIIKFSNAACDHWLLLWFYFSDMFITFIFISQYIMNISLKCWSKLWETLSITCWRINFNLPDELSSGTKHCLLFTPSDCVDGELLNFVSDEAWLPPEFKHITKGRTRN